MPRSSKDTQLEQHDVSAQIARLRTLSEDGPLDGAVRSIAGILVLCLIGIWLTGDSLLNLISILGAFLSAAMLVFVLPHRPLLRNAAKATRTGRREAATMELHLSFDEDGRIDGAHGVLQLTDDRHAPRWEMQLLRPDGWTPQAGAIAVEAVFLSDIPCPVLLIHRDGLLVPAAKPRRLG